MINHVHRMHTHWRTHHNGARCMPYIWQACWAAAVCLFASALFHRDDTPCLPRLPPTLANKHQHPKLIPLESWYNFCYIGPSAWGQGRRSTYNIPPNYQVECQRQRVLRSPPKSRRRRSTLIRWQLSECFCRARPAWQSVAVSVLPLKL